jgi:predicted molibdopterin-dependent oxidoreductase YjgC
MVKLKLDNIDHEVPGGSTVLEAARSAGINIPTLCNCDGLPHYSSCMVCMVRNIKTGGYLPSCSALVQDGMEIDCSSIDVIDIRKKAVELLLAEHRAECEAPCKIVCPGNYNIPLMNRLLAEENYDEAIKLSITQVNLGLRCINCSAYCENACRRKKIDIPVSIRNLQIFVYQKLNKDFNPDEEIIIRKKEKTLKPFSSRIGHLETEEMKEWLKECKNDLLRVKEIADTGSASMESASCMHCDCRAKDDCKLRNISEELAIKDPSGKLVNAQIQKKINKNTGLIFENAKCIKCGLCVRLCEELKEEPALCFIKRGFVSIISEPLTEDFDNIIKTRSKEVVDICPTGALSFK